MDGIYPYKCAKLAIINSTFRWCSISLIQRAVSWQGHMKIEPMWLTKHCVCYIHWVLFLFNFFVTFNCPENYLHLSLYWFLFLCNTGWQSGSGTLIFPLTQFIQNLGQDCISHIWYGSQYWILKLLNFHASCYFISFWPLPPEAASHSLKDGNARGRVLFWSVLLPIQWWQGTDLGAQRKLKNGKSIATLKPVFWSCYL